MDFQLHTTDTLSSAHARTITTDHGKIQTPIFMPVGTASTVKAIHISDVHDDAQAQIILDNTYHLYLRKGLEVLESRRAGYL